MGGFWIIIFLTLFVSGLLTLFFLKRRNLLIVLMAFELMFFSIGVAFIFFAISMFDFKGFIYALILLAVAAGESAVGLSIIMLLFKRCGTIKINEFRIVKH